MFFGKREQLPDWRKEELNKYINIIYEIFGKKNLEQKKLVLNEDVFPENPKINIKNYLAIVERNICRIMDVDPLNIVFATDSFHNAAGKFKSFTAENKMYGIITLDKDITKNSIDLVTTLSHELSHYKLLLEYNTEISNEILTDCIPIFFGFGLFQAYSLLKIGTNLSFRHQGYLTETDMGYLLARWVWDFKRFDETKKIIRKYLSRNIKDAFNRSLARLEKDNGIQELSTSSKLEHQRLYDDFPNIRFDKYLSSNGFLYTLALSMEKKRTLMLFVSNEGYAEDFLLEKRTYFEEFYGHNDYIEFFANYLLERSDPNGELAYRKNGKTIKSVKLSDSVDPGETLDYDLLCYKFSLKSFETITE